MEKLDNSSPDSTPSAPLVTLSARLLDADFREGYQIGFEAALAELLARCEFLLTRTVALPILRNDIQEMKEHACSMRAIGRRSGKQRAASCGRLWHLL